MKKIYPFILAFILLGGVAKAQTNLTNAVDFTVTDVDGNSHNLFNILASGKYVCIDFFFTTCGPCQATSPYYHQTFTHYGCNTQNVYFMAIDLNDDNSEVIAYANTFLGGPPGYPEVSGLQGNGNFVVSVYGIGAFPTYILIAPDQSIIEQDMWPISSSASFDNYFASNGLPQVPCLTTGVNDLLPANAVNIFPNPVGRWLNIEARANIQSAVIFDMLGKKCMEKIFSSGTRKETLDVKTLLPGIYFVQVRDEKNNLASRKIVKM